MTITVQEISAIYDRAYANPGLMGTNVDQEYSRITKSTLVRMCQPAMRQRVLDLGAGDGDLGQFLPPSIEWHATDISPVGMARTRTRFGRVQAAAACAEALPYPDHWFDAVIAADTMEHVIDLPASLGEVRRVLRPEGIFALSVPAPSSLRQWLYNHLFRQRPNPLLLARFAWTVAKRQLLFGKAAFQPIDRDLSLAEWRSALSDAGFTISETKAWPQSPMKPIVYLIRN